jgi:hypothetical protein
VLRCPKEENKLQVLRMMSVKTDSNKSSMLVTQASMKMLKTGPSKSSNNLRLKTLYSIKMVKYNNVLRS